MSEFKLKAVVQRELFYDESKLYGVYAFTLVESEKDVEINKYNNFTISGSTHKLLQGKEYEIEVEPSFSKKYGKGLEFVLVESPQPKTIQEQQDYFESQLTENQFKSFMKAYPNSLLLDKLKEDSFDVGLLDGIGEKTLASLKKKLLDNIEANQIVSKLRDLEVSPIAAQTLLKHFGSSKAVIDSIEKNIYTLCQVKGFGFVKVDKYALNRGDSKDNPNRIESAIEYVIEETQKEGHTWIQQSELYNQVGKIADLPPFVIEPILQTISEKEDHNIGVENKRVFIKKTKEREQIIADIALKRANTKEVNKMEDSLLEKKIKLEEDRNGFKFSSEQKEAIKGAINNNIYIINGKAGTGKTATLKGIINILEDQTYVTCALSGAAARVLSSEGLTSRTMHLLLGFDRSTGGFLFNKDNKLPYDMVIIDEMSMPSLHMIYHVLVAIKDNAKVILVGDIGQLPSVGEGAVFSDLLQSSIVPNTEYTQIHRQAAKSGIALIAEQVRDGNHITEEYNYDTKTYGELKDISIIPTNDEENIGNIILDIANKLKSTSLLDFQILAPVKARGDISVKSLNIGLQAIYNDVEKPFIAHGAYKYREGDKVIHNGQNYSAMTEDEEEITIYNGTLGIIESIKFGSNPNPKHELTIKFVGVDERVVYENKDLEFIELAYAITVHKSQGSSIKKVLFVFDFTSYMLLSKELVYTGITRASEACILVANNKALRKAIQTNSSNSRRTFLNELIK